MPPTRTPSRQPARTAAAPAAPIPFTAAAHEHTESVVVDANIAGALGAAQVPRGPFDVPAYGFLRHIFMECILAGGTLGPGVLSADFPWNILQSLALVDVNGAPIYGPLDGYASLWANVVGGYAYRQDPRLGPWFNGTINGSFFLRVPVEISRHNGYGALANQNAAAAYKLGYTVNSNAVFATQPTTVPTVTLRPQLEAWSQPNATDLTGRPQFREPPGHGTTQFWTAFTKGGLAAGQQNILLPRVGNLIRNLVFIARDNTGARNDGVMPNPIQFMWDARILHLQTQNHHIQRFMESLEAPSARDTGVFAYTFDNLVAGHSGDEEPNLWLPTVQSSRLEVDGTSTVAGSVQIITNDVAPVEVAPDERFVENSATGFHPAVGQPVPMAM